MLHRTIYEAIPPPGADTPTHFEGLSHGCLFQGGRNSETQKNRTASSRSLVMNSFGIMGQKEDNNSLSTLSDPFKSDNIIIWKWSHGRALIENKRFALFCAVDDDCRRR